MHKPRFKWITQSIAESFEVNDRFVEDSLRSGKSFQMIDEFLAGKGTPKIFVYYIPPHDPETASNGDGLENYLFVTDGENEKLEGKAVYFHRTAPEGKAINVEVAYDADVMFGELSPNIPLQLEVLVNKVYEPMIGILEKNDWGECDEEQKAEFTAFTKKFANDIHKIMESLTEGVTITVFDHKVYKEKEKLGEKERLEFLQNRFEYWLNEIEKHLNQEPDTRKDNSELGPSSELVYWVGRMAKITNLSEQLKSADFKLAKEELWKERTKENRFRGNDEHIQRLMTQFNLIDITITDKLNEAKDNVKYLTTLD